MKEKILLAEDEKELAKAVETILQYNNYFVTTVYNGKDAFQKVLEESYDIIIMDIMMPVMDGIVALKEIRKSGISTPIILLTAKSQINDKVEGLDAGANDYLTKPFDKKELLARIRALSRNDILKKEKCKIGNVLFDKENSKISNSKMEFNLNHKECEIMEILIKNQERNVSSNELIKRIWKSDNIEESAVSMYISYLQEKFIALDANIKINNINNNSYILEKKL